MKFCTNSLLLAMLLPAGSITAFMSPSARRSFVATTTTAREMVFDPSHIHDALLNSLTIADLDDAAATVDAIASSVPDTAAAADATTTAAAAAATTQGNGWFGFLAEPIEGLLKVVHSLLVAAGLDSNAWGISILTIVLLIKLVTFPLTKAQLESTTKMQIIQPQLKELQVRYQSNPDVMNQKIAEMYKVNEVNPLAGCIPSLIQIPVFIGLYRAVLTLAKEDKLNEPFLWLPNLEGPTYGADPAHGSDWIMKGWVDGTPSLGWTDTLAFLALPAILILSQFVSMQLMQPKSDDANSPQNNPVLKVLPLMIGYFSLNVPAALCVYWVANNVITTATTVAIRNGLSSATTSPVGGGGGPTAPTDSGPTYFTSSTLGDKPTGFGSYTPPPPSGVGGNSIKPLTPVDVEVLAKDTLDSDDDDDVPSLKKRGKKKN
mmetsp:Transcript_26269/g.40287  ORF Transcript_26269/g.40287 Transcript_26269/m.40287 type:complete len:432 (+) Transcript_26269:28-1323(+)